jgi:hypothetical protein
VGARHEFRRHEGGGAEQQYYDYRKFLLFHFSLAEPFPLKDAINVLGRDVTDSLKLSVSLTSDRMLQTTGAGRDISCFREDEDNPI